MTEIIETLAISTRTTWTYGGTQLKNLIFKSGRKNGGAVEVVLEYGLTGGRLYIILNLPLHLLYTSNLGLLTTYLCLYATDLYLI
jgi:hypothetical protein